MVLNIDISSWIEEKWAPHWVSHIPIDTQLHNTTLWIMVQRMW